MYPPKYSALRVVIPPLLSTFLSTFPSALSTTVKGPIVL